MLFLDKRVRQAAEAVLMIQSQRLSMLDQSYGTNIVGETPERKMGPRTHNIEAQSKRIRYGRTGHERHVTETYYSSPAVKLGTSGSGWRHLAQKVSEHNYRHCH